MTEGTREVSRRRPSFADLPRALRGLVRTIDAFTAWAGKTIAWATVLPLVFVVVHEVIRRYLFNDPSIWAYDISYMLYGSLFMLAVAYTLLNKGHIRTDIFYDKWSPRVQGLVDALLYLLIFFPGLFLFLLAGSEKAVYAWSIAEKSDASPWRPIIYPYKAVIPLATALLLLQGVSEFVKSVYAVVRGRWP